MVTKPGSLRIDRVRRQLERWRHTRPHPRAPIPETLWTAAVALVPQHGLYGTARGVRVDYGALKRHVEAATRTESAPVPAEFIELSAPRLRESGACVIEIEGPRATLRLRLPELPLSDLASLSRRLVGIES